MPAQRITELSRFSYGLGGVAIGVVYQSLSTLLIYYYTVVVGLTAAQAGILVFVSTLWDGLADTLIAWAASRTRSRFGQYRPWLLYASLPMGLLFLLMFWRPDLPARLLLAYALVTSMVFRSLFQAVYLPYVALLGQISNDARERARLAGWKGAAIAGAQLLASLLGLTLIGWLGHGDLRRGFAGMALVFAPVIGASLFATGWLTRENAAVAATQTSDTGRIGAAARLILANPPMLWLFSSVFLFTAAYTLLGSLTIHLFQYKLANLGGARWALGALAGAGFVAAPFWSAMAVRFGKRVAWMAGAGAASCACLALYLADPGSSAGVIAFYGVIGFCLQTVTVLQFASLADAVDFGEWRSGGRVSAFGFGTLTLVSKTSLAFGGGAAGMLLSAIDFTPHGAHPAAMIEHLRAGMLLISAAGFAASAALISRFRVTNTLHRQIMAALATRALRPSLDR